MGTVECPYQSFAFHLTVQLKLFARQLTRSAADAKQRSVDEDDNETSRTARDACLLQVIRWLQIDQP
jgi:hypothetical protein